MIRTLIVDDHPAVRSGLLAALRSEPGLVPLPPADGMRTGLFEAEQSGPDVVLADYQLPDGDGLVLCHELKLLGPPPAVLIYSAFARRELALAAAVAGADGMVDKGAPLASLLEAIRTVVRGGKALPPLRPDLVERTVRSLEPEDLPILGMRMDDATLSEIASALQLDEREVSRRVAGILGRLGPAAAAAPR